MRERERERERETAQRRNVHDQDKGEQTHRANRSAHTQTWHARQWLLDVVVKLNLLENNVFQLVDLDFRASPSLVVAHVLECTKVLVSISWRRRRMRRGREKEEEEEEEEEERRKVEQSGS